MSREGVELADMKTGEDPIQVNVHFEPVSHHEDSDDDEANEAKIALMLSACAKNNVNKVSALIRGGLSADSCDYDKRSGLHLAASEGHIDIVRLLTQEGANVNCKDRFNSTPLDDAVRHGFMDIVDFLRSAGAKHGTIGKFEADLIQAAHDGNVAEAERLIKNGVSAQCSDYDKRTPLHLAVAEGHVELCKLLLAQGADPKAEDRWGVTPLYEANRRGTRTGADPIKELFSKYQKHEEHDMLTPFVKLFGIWEVIIIILFGIFLDYDSVAGGNSGTASADNLAHLANYYAMYQDVNVMIFIGFGFLMVFLRKHGYNSVGLNFLLAAFVIQWYILTASFWQGVFSSFSYIKINITNLIKADFAAGAVLITYGAVLGKVSPFQIMFVALIETIFYSLNEEIGLKLYITDLGGSQVIHQFGAFFGLSLSIFLTPKEAHGNPHNAAVYHSDIMAMIGTIFLWMYWPSFNAALGSGATQSRAVINTTLSLTGSCVAAFLASYVFRGENRFNMVDIQNATLAGGVAMGASADLIIKPGSAIAIGAIAGTVSVLGYVYVQPYLEKKIGLHDTCGVHNLHGMPSLIGGFAGVIATSQSSIDGYGIDQIIMSMPKRLERSANKQAAYQFAYMVITMFIALASGAITGIIANHKFFDAREGKKMFVDELDWEVPELEIPYYFDHRGEISRDVVGVSRTFSDQDDSAAPAAFNKGEIDTRMEKLEQQIKKLKSAPAAPASGDRLTMVLEKLLTKLDKSA